VSDEPCPQPLSRLDPAPVVLPPDARLLVVMPTWLGDCVMASPVLRGLRERYPRARITAMLPRAWREVMGGSPGVDRWISPRSRRRCRARGSRSAKASPLQLGSRLRAGGFHAALLMPNSFRWALAVFLAGIPIRVGYRRDLRPWLLTRALTRGHHADGTPVSTRDEYLRLAACVDAAPSDPTPRLTVGGQAASRAESILHEAGYAAGDQRPLVVLNPGASFGAAKLWPAERFGQVADDLHRRGCVLALSGAPSERAVLDRVHEAARVAILDLPHLGVGLAELKAVLRRARLLISNDTGTRHLALALGTACLTVYGPTDPRRTDMGLPHDVTLRIPVPCGPCQQKVCPLGHHRCMDLISPQLVCQQAAGLLFADPHARTTSESGHLGSLV